MPVYRVICQGARCNIERGVCCVDYQIITQNGAHGAYQMPHVFLIGPHKAKLILHLQICLQISRCLPRE